MGQGGVDAQFAPWALEAIAQFLPAFGVVVVPVYFGVGVNAPTARVFASPLVGRQTPLAGRFPGPDAGPDVRVKMEAVGTLLGLSHSV